MSRMVVSLRPIGEGLLRGPRQKEDVMANQTQLPTPDPALRRLDRFVGTWSMEGHLIGSDEITVRVRRHSSGCRAASSSNSARP